MLFSCPRCDREEEIILDRKPPCRRCGNEMTPASDYSQVWMSPYTAIVRMRALSERCGIERARTDGRFKREREAFATGVLALALSKLKGDEWWVEVETVENTPDTKLRQFEQTEKGNVIHTRNVENVDWDENVDDVMTVIKKKCKRAYPSHYLLVVHARNYEKVLNLDRVIEEMKDLKSPFLEVWLVAVPAPNSLNAVRISPGPLAVDLGRTDMEKATKQNQFVQLGTRGCQPGFYDAGIAFLPLPRCE